MFKNEFELKILKSNGQNFQEFFQTIMRKKHNVDFTEVEANGNIGDRKNDGYLHKVGIFYQVYGPEDYSKNSTQRTAVKKFREDFEGLMEHEGKGDWGKVHEFVFVINTKKIRLDPTLCKERETLKKEYPNIEINIYTEKNLYEDFLTLPEYQKNDIFKGVKSIKNESSHDQVQVPPSKKEFSNFYKWFSFNINNDYGKEIIDKYLNTFINEYFNLSYNTKKYIYIVIRYSQKDLDGHLFFKKSKILDYFLGDKDLFYLVDRELKEDKRIEQYYHEEGSYLLLKNLNFPTPESEKDLYVYNQAVNIYYICSYLKGDFSNSLDNEIKDTEKEEKEIFEALKRSGREITEEVYENNPRVQKLIAKRDRYNELKDLKKNADERKSNFYENIKEVFQNENFSSLV